MSVPHAIVDELMRGESRRANLARKNLKDLNCTGPADLWDVQTLTYLNVCKNKLEDFPAHISQLPNLEQLHVADNRLKSFNGINEYKKLSFLNLNQNMLTAFPRGVGGCPNLQMLDLSMNLIKEVPTNLRFCLTLRALWLSDNEIVSLPDCITELPNLQTLGLRNNRIELLPNDIGDMPKLKELYVDDNCLRVLPTSMKNCLAIKDGGTFTCVNNFFCPPVEEALLLSHIAQNFLPVEKLCESQRYEDFYNGFVKRPPPLEDGMRKALERRDASKK